MNFPINFSIVIICYPIFSPPTFNDPGSPRAAGLSATSGACSTWPDARHFWSAGLQQKTVDLTIK